MKKLAIFCISLMTILCLCGIAAAANNQVIVVGQNGIYDLQDAMNAISANAGDVTIYLTGTVNQTSEVQVPAGLSGLNSVTLASYTGAPVSVALNRYVICANSVPFTVGTDVTLSDGFLVGGKCLLQAGNTSADHSMLVINGAADIVIGGGMAIVNGAVSSVTNTNVIINGSAGSVFGGGFAYGGGSTPVSGTANVYLAGGSYVSGVVYGGGFAMGNGTQAATVNTNVVSLGTASAVHSSEGLSENGGSALVGANASSPAPQIGLVNDTQPFTDGQIVRNPNTVIYVGPGQAARNFNDAVNQIPMNAGNVTFYVTGSFAQNNNEVEIPTNRGITGLTIAPQGGSVTVTWAESTGFYANGIPTVIANGITFSNGIVYGGANTLNGRQSQLPTTYLDISGTVNTVVGGSKAKNAGSAAYVGNSTIIFRGKANGWIYAGGSALYGGYSVVQETAYLDMNAGASATQSVAGGGYAFGQGSVSVVKDSYLDVKGSVVYAVYLGGYADQTSVSTTTGQAYLVLEPTGSVSQSVWYGGRAYKNSNVSVNNASALIQGRVGVAVRREGRASDGGSVTVSHVN